MPELQELPSTHGLGGYLMRLKSKVNDGGTIVFSKLCRTIVVEPVALYVDPLELPTPVTSARLAWISRSPELDDDVPTTTWNLPLRLTSSVESSPSGTATVPLIGRIMEELAAYACSALTDNSNNPTISVLNAAIFIILTS